MLNHGDEGNEDEQRKFPDVAREELLFKPESCGDERERDNGNHVARPHAKTTGPVKARRDEDPPEKHDPRDGVCQCLVFSAQIIPAENTEDDQRRVPEDPFPQTDDESVQTLPRCDEVPVPETFRSDKVQGAACFEQISKTREVVPEHQDANDSESQKKQLAEDGAGLFVLFPVTAGEFIITIESVERDKQRCSDMGRDRTAEQYTAEEYLTLQTS